jgi:hypothetical protein
MDRAQIERAIASGQGWSTHGKDVAKNIWSDTYNAPLPPFIDAIAPLPVKRFRKKNARTLISTNASS